MKLTKISQVEDFLAAVNAAIATQNIGHVRNVIAAVNDPAQAAALAAQQAAQAAQQAAQNAQQPPQQASEVVQILKIIQKCKNIGASGESQ